MGKKARKTRWRALPMADEVSDSEDSTNPPTPGAPRWHYQKQPPGRFLSQPSPRRRYDVNGTDKSTRSSSTASENKITFNEDEYTKITTPRQDVLFKKGYLNKPRSYQTQTSTGTSTTSTGNSTGNGTPDHQSTDLEYESQFMFPNGFVDQNGIYYVNSYEPYPLMLYNPSTYYQEYTSVDKKRYSTGSLTESTSPNNEETTSQEHSQTGSEAPVGHQYYNMVYPGYYVNSVCPSSDLPNGHSANEPLKRLKKRRRRKTSTSQTTQEDTSEYTDEKSSEDEETTKSHPPSSISPASCGSKVEEITEDTKPSEESSPKEANEEQPEETPRADAEEAIPSESPKPKYDLKPDAQEFVPRAFRNRELPPIPVKLVPPNFVPIPLLPVGDQAFIPPAIPVNFFPGPAGFVSFVPPPFELAKPEGQIEQKQEGSDGTTNREETKEQPQPMSKNAIDIASVVSKLEEAVKEQESQKAEEVSAPRPSQPQRNQRFRNSFRRNVYKTKTPQNSGEQTPVCNGYRVYQEPKEENNEPVRENSFHRPPLPGSPHNQNRSSPQRFDIASVVSKLEEAVKEQESQKAEEVSAPRPSQPQRNQRFRNSFRRNVYKTKTPQNSGEQTPVCNGYRVYQEPKEENNEPVRENSFHRPPLPGSPHNQNRSSPQRFRKNWKQNGFQKGSPRRFQTSPGHVVNGYCETKPKMNAPNYSDLLKKPETRHPNYEKQNSCPPKLEAQVKDVKTENVKNNVAPTRPNQWIPVSSKKKRKGKSTEESEDVAVFESEQVEQLEEFESYDVSLLVDVVPSSKNEDNVENQPQVEIEVKENGVEEILTTIITANTPTNEAQVKLKIPEVSEIEKELITTVEEVKVEQAKVEEVTEETKKEEETVVVNEETKNKPKKKSKKGPQKAVTKRVIITDIDLSMNFTSPVEPTEKKVESKEQVVAPTQEPAVVEEETPKEESEKKSKKKKKKPAKAPAANGSLSGSNATLNATDETYDFLLDNSTLSEAADKTNDELSQEFDKIIQKGMYSSLEGKIKSLNIDPSDGFFKNVLLGGAPPKLDKPSFSNGAAFGAAFHRQPLKPVSVAAPTVADGNAVVPDAAATGGEGSGFVLEGAVEAPAAHPVTEAVREWMARAREAAPDVELLKSPGEIYEELESEDEVSRECVADHRGDTVQLCSIQDGCAKCNVNGRNEDQAHLREEKGGVCCSLQ